MILPIYLYGQPVLRKEAEELTPDYPKLKELVASIPSKVRNKSQERDL